MPVLRAVPMHCVMLPPNSTQRRAAKVPGSVVGASGVCPFAVVCWLCAWAVNHIWCTVGIENVLNSVVIKLVWAG